MKNESPILCRFPAEARLVAKPPSNHPYTHRHHCGACAGVFSRVSKMPYNPQEYAEKKKRQIARAKEIKESRAAAAAAGGAGGGGRSGSGGAAVAVARKDVDLAQHVSRGGPIAQASGKSVERYGLDGDGRGHINAYVEYKRIVGDADGGTPFTDAEYVASLSGISSGPCCRFKSCTSAHAHIHTLRMRVRVLIHSIHPCQPTPPSTPSIHSTWPSNHRTILPCCGCAALCCSVLGMPRSSSANIQTEFRRTVEGLE